jgi:CRISPR-associated protein (TIGR03985 family)
MSHQYFSDLPNVELLQWLARGSLKQNLSRAIRLWAWLRCLYGEEDSQVKLPDTFAFAEWQEAFFTATHPQSDSWPEVHDPQCRCAQSTAEWLFSEETGLQRKDWIKSLKQHDSLPENIADTLASRLFGVTRRSLYDDLQILDKLGWVKRQGNQYTLVDSFPSRPKAQTSATDSAILQPDLAAIAGNLSRRINGWQRFFLHVDYVIPSTATDQVDEWQAQLGSLWERVPIPPVRLTFYSAKLNKILKGIVYPICIYYVQRAPYLCAWGETPLGVPGRMDWCNYRLDRIQDVQALKWRDREVPPSLHQAYQQGQLPTPDYIQEQMAEAWGFDFYKPASLLLLRFERWFDEGYIQGTVRHDTFEPVTYAEANQLIQQQATDPTQRQRLLKILASRSPDDAYYKAYYREDDPNVKIRLRAWRPKMEVFLPGKLREQIADEVRREMQLYQD